MIAYPDACSSANCKRLDCDGCEHRAALEAFQVSVRAAAGRTVAETVAARFHDDGQRFRNAAGENLCDVCERLAVRRRHSFDRDMTRYTFADGSVIVAGSAAWDLGYPGCFCWQGVGHDDRCEDPGVES